VAETEVLADVAAVGVPPITSGVYKIVAVEVDVAKEIVVWSGDDECGLGGRSSCCWQDSC